jgi:hypothetical protein
MSFSASMEQGMVKLNWVEHVIAVQSEGEQFGDAVRDQVQILCPGFASRVGDWQHMKSLVSRVPAESLEAIARWQDQMKTPVPPVPQTWFKHPWALICGERKSQGNVDEGAHVLMTQRWLGQLSSIAVTHQYDVSNEAELIAAQRHFALEARHRCRDAAVKFCKGIQALKRTTGVDYLVKASGFFATGKSDSEIINAHDVEVSARFWQVIKDADEVMQGEKKRVLEAQREARDFKLAEVARAAQMRMSELQELSRVELQNGSVVSEVFQEQLHAQGADTYLAQLAEHHSAWENTAEKCLEEVTKLLAARSQMISAR